MQVGIQVVSIESQELYLHYQADRVPNLNSHALDIISAQDHSQPGHKALVYIGAAHTNSHNDPGRLTPGMTETLQPRGATEMLIVAGHPNKSPQIHSIGDGQVFGVT